MNVLQYAAILNCLSGFASMTTQEILNHVDALSAHLQALLTAQGDAPNPSLQRALVNLTEAVKALKEVKA